MFATHYHSLVEDWGHHSEVHACVLHQAALASSVVLNKVYLREKRSLVALASVLADLYYERVEGVGFSSCYSTLTIPSEEDINAQADGYVCRGTDVNSHSRSQVALGHMSCLVEDNGGEQRVTFLYKLAPGPCPKSFGINVARLAQLPDSVSGSMHSACSACYVRLLVSHYFLQYRDTP